MLHSELSLNIRAHMLLLLLLSPKLRLKVVYFFSNFVVDIDVLLRSFELEFVQFGL